MEDYRSIDYQLIGACRAYPPDFVTMRTLVAQGADVNAFSGTRADDCVLSEVLFCYPEVNALRDYCCGVCKEMSCQGCSLDIPDADGRYLPQIIQFFLENGFDVTGNHGQAGALALESLKFATKDRYALDACKLLLQAGADPSISPYSDDSESVLDSVASEASYQGCCEQNHSLESLYDTMCQMMETKMEGRIFWLMEYYDVCIGRQLDGIRLYSKTEKSRGVFSVDLPASRHSNCFMDTVVLDCRGKQLCVTNHIALFVDPSIPQNAVKAIDLSPWLPDCVGHKITAIDFRHASIWEGTTSYGQPIILIRLDNGRTIRFSHNFGEVPREDTVAWFTLE